MQSPTMRMPYAWDARHLLCTGTNRVAQCSAQQSSKQHMWVVLILMTLVHLSTSTCTLRDKGWMACPYAQRGSPPKVQVPDACHHLGSLAMSSTRSLKPLIQTFTSCGVRVSPAAAPRLKTSRHRTQTALRGEVYTQKGCTQLIGR